MTTTLSAWSRITSSSYSFHPSTDCSTRISPTGLAAEPARGDLAHLGLVARDAGAATAEDERRPDDDRVADDLRRPSSASSTRVREPRPRDREPDLLHRGLEPRPVLGGVDRLDARADQLDAVAVEHARVVQGDREVQRGLAPERRAAARRAARAR